MIAFDPRPFSPGHEASDPVDLILRQRAPGIKVIKTVT